MSFKFPVYFKTVKKNELPRFYRYSEGNRVLEFDKFSISAHAMPYIMNTKDEFFQLISILKNRTGIEEIKEEEFNYQFELSVKFIFNEGVNPKDFWSKEQIKANNDYLKKSE